MNDVVLVVCTANQIRSVLFEALLRRRAPEDVELASAGLLQAGAPAPRETVKAAASLGIDLAGYRSRTLDRRSLWEMDLILCAERRHVGEVFAIDPSAFRRTYTIRELVAAADAVPARGDAEPLVDYALRLDTARTVSRVVDGPEALDVADPSGSPLAAVIATANELDRLAERTAQALWPHLLAGTARRRPDAEPHHTSPARVDT